MNSANILMVPVQLDALHLKNPQPVVEAMADFTRLPYSDGHRDINPDTPYLSEAIISQPFQNQNLYLKDGLHLHWSLPDALTRGSHSPERTAFPPVPNRWLVTRTGGGAANGQWIVESDYLFPEGEGSGSVSIPYPYDQRPGQSQDQPFRHLGRRISLDDWLDAQQVQGPKAEYLDELTAVGYGQPAFAAFYPNCHSVFGFYDGEYPGDIPNDLQYEVIGWYSNPEQDYLNRFVAAHQQEHANNQPTDEELLEALKADLKWTAIINPGESFPKQMLCYARWTSEGLTDNPDREAGVTITVGNTGTEALSAYLAQQIDSGYQAIIEDQLEALQLADRLEGRQLDTGPKFREARHEKGFRAVTSGSLWTIRPKTQAASPADAIDAQAGLQITLPEAMAQQLNTLNSRQQAYDRALHEIESMRGQLFSDWYKYMLCAYPPEDTRDDYPDIDEVKFYIEQKGVEPLRQKMAATGTLFLERDETGQVIAARSGDSTSSAARLAQAVNDLLAAIAAHNKETSLSPEAANGPGTIYTLKQIPAPRYWQPTEPVVLMTGEAVKPTPRHGQAGSLECHILRNTQLQYPPAKGDDLKAISAELDKIEKSLTGEHFAFCTQSQQPWHPFLLEWEVAVLPTKHRSNLHPESRAYASDFITRNYILAENEVDLSVRQGTEGEVEAAANLYSGRSILTPHANIQLAKRVAAYLQDVSREDCYQAKTIPKEVGDDYSRKLNEWWDAENSLSKKPVENWQKVQEWYETKPVYDETTHSVKTFAELSRQEQVQDPIYTAIRACQHLQTLNCLSQALGGFNQALLMHKQTMQMPIADPLGFDVYQSFANDVRDAVQRSIRSAPEPLNDFNPIRSGAMQIRRLRLVDTFGQVKDLDLKKITVNTSEVMTSPTSPHRISLAPRLTQPARLNFRWLAASGDEQEMNDHPATTPICGWILPNLLDDSLMIYDNQGQALGSISIDPDQPWQPAPGCDEAVALAEISNPHLKKVVTYLVARQNNSSNNQQAPTFVENLVATLDAGLETIDPEGFAHHQAQALLMGRPIALVRASLNLELHGCSAIHQGWNEFRQDMQRNTRDSDDFTQVQFPIRLGEYHQFNDGLVGYWKEAGDGYEDNLFYAPQSYANGAQDEYIRTHRPAEPLNIYQSLDTPPQILAMLIDPRGKVHATCGILPAKAIDIPPDQYSAALQAIEITFLSAPILSDREKMRLPLPAEPGYIWSWLEKKGENGWAKTLSIPTIKKELFLEHYSGQNGEGAWQHLLDPEIGWLRTIEDDASKAIIIAKDARKQPKLQREFAGLEVTIQGIFDLCQVSLGPISSRATFSGPQAIREGWLKLSTANEQTTTEKE